MSTPAPEWVTISTVQPGDQIGFIGRFPSGRDAWAHEDTSWRTVAHVAIDGRSRILTFDDGSEFDAGHAYRLWVRRPI